MSNTIGHRASTSSKYSLNKQQADDERAAKERRKQEVDRFINEKNPNLAIEKKKREETVDRCRDGLMNSYLANFSKLFDKIMLWPFVPGLKTGEAVTAGARLVLFCCVAFVLAVLASKSLPPSLAKSLELFDIDMDTSGVLLTASIAILPNVLYYVIQRTRLKMCLSRAKKELVDGQAKMKEAEKKLDQQTGETENFYQHEGRIASENLIREPIRQETSLGGHPGVAGIL